jgi:hypothetical protein
MKKGSNQTDSIPLDPDLGETGLGAPRQKNFPRRLQVLRTWLLVVCDGCGHHDRVPTVFRRKTAVEKYATRREPLRCSDCDASMMIVMVERIPEPMRSWINEVQA